MNFLKRHFKKILFFLTIFILIIMIGLSPIGRMEGANLGFFGNFIAGLQKLTYKAGGTFTNSFYSVQEIVKMREENIMLTENVYKLRDQVRMLENIVNKSDALKTEYEMRKSLSYDYVVGQVIAVDNSNWFSRFTIDRGENDGIRQNDIVIQAVKTDDNIVQIGLLGIVAETSSDWSKIITVTDERCKVSFKNNANDESGIVQGSIDGTITGYFFNSKAGAKAGDSLVTSGIGEVYIPDIYIGDVKDVVKTTDASTLRIIVEPAVDLTKIGRVYILTK